MFFTKAIVRPPAFSFANGITAGQLGPPNYELALEQHAAYCEAVEQCGLTLIRLEADDHYPDSTFVEDTAVILRSLNAEDRAINGVITRPGAVTRRGEIKSIEQALLRHIKDFYFIEEPGTLDGGDICEADDHFFIGVSERTNEAGAEQLAMLVNCFGYTSSVIDIRNIHSLLHLKSGLAYLGENRLAVIDELVKEDSLSGFELVRVDPRENYAANCVRVNDHLLIAAGYPTFETTLREVGYKTIALGMTEFQKMDGGLSCLSLRF